MITYKQAGVDVEAGQEVVRRIKKVAKKIGFFGGFFPMGRKMLVGASDGVGTKLKIAFLMDKHDTVGIDLVAMNVNDVVSSAARPLFFLDYIACQKIHPPKIEKVVKGIITGCKQAKCELLGGETAELSDMYKENEYDLAGFCVGIAEKNKLITGSKIRPGNKIIGLASTGLHSNGYTLARKVLLDTAKLNLKDYIEDLEQTLGEELLTPTKIYTQTILEMVKKYRVRGIAHITGGGMPENVARLLPKRTQAVIDLHSWTIPTIFRMIQKLGKVDHEEMYKTFNMGIGMVLVVEAREFDKIMRFLAKKKEKAYLIGEIGKGKQEVIII